MKKILSLILIVVLSLSLFSLASFFQLASNLFHIGAHQ